MEKLNQVLMRAGVRAPSDFVGALIMLGFALITWIQLGRTNTSQFGGIITATTVPYFFISFVFIMSGLVLVGSFFRTDEKLVAPRLRPMIFIIGGIIAFGVSVRPMGLAFSGFISTLISCFATEDFRPVEALITSLALSAGCVLFFVYALGLYLPVWPEGW